MAEPRADSGGRLRRLAEELEEIGLPFDPASPADRVIIDEIDYAVRPAVHERRVPTYGALVDPAPTRPGGSAVRGCTSADVGSGDWRRRTPVVSPTAARAGSSGGGTTSNSRCSTARHRPSATSS